MDASSSVWCHNATTYSGWAEGVGIRAERKTKRPHAVEGRPFWDSRNSPLLLAGGCLKSTDVVVRVKQLSLLVFIIFLSSSILVSFLPHVMFLFTGPPFFSYPSVSCWYRPLASPFSMYSSPYYQCYLIFSWHCTLSFCSSIFISFIICFPTFFVILFCLCRVPFLVRFYTLYFIFLSGCPVLGTAVAQWLRRCATNRKVAGSIPAGVNGIFHRHNPSDRTMALRSTQPLTEMSTRSIW